MERTIEVRLAERFPSMTEDAISKLSLAANGYYLSGILDTWHKENDPKTSEIRAGMKAVRDSAMAFLEVYSRNLNTPMIGPILLKAYCIGCQDVRNSDVGKSVTNGEYSDNIIRNTQALLTGIESWQVSAEYLKEGVGRPAGSGSPGPWKLIKDVFDVLHSILCRPPERNELEDCCAIMGYENMTEYAKKLRRIKGLRSERGRKPHIK